MISLTDSALSAVKNALIRSGKEGAGFRVKAEAGGCAGYKYRSGSIRNVVTGTPSSTLATTCGSLSIRFRSRC